MVGDRDRDQDGAAGGTGRGAGDSTGNDHGGSRVLGESEEDGPEAAGESEEGDAGAAGGRADGASVVGDLVARDRRSDRPALLAPRVDRSYSWFDLCTTAYRSGNVLRYLGVRERSLVAVEPDPLPEPVLAFLGAALLGATTRFEHREDGEARAMLVPVEREGEFDPPAGTKLAVYGGPPAASTTTHWEAEVWSENPAVHPASVSPGDDALRAAGRSYTHAELLAGAVDVAERVGLTPADRVAVRGSLRHPGVVVAGVLAPLYAGGSFVVDPPDEGSYDVGITVGGEPPEARVVDAGAVVDGADVGGAGDALGER